MHWPFSIFFFIQFRFKYIIVFDTPLPPIQNINPAEKQSQKISSVTLKTITL